MTCGCALLFKGTKEEVNFASEPGSAEMYVDGSKIGNTPCPIKVGLEVTV